MVHLEVEARAVLRAGTRVEIVMADPEEARGVATEAATAEGLLREALLNNSAGVALQAKIRGCISTTTSTSVKENNVSRTYPLDHQA